MAMMKWIVGNDCPWESSISCRSGSTLAKILIPMVGITKKVIRGRCEKWEYWIR